MTHVPLQIRNSEGLVIGEIDDRFAEHGVLQKSVRIVDQVGDGRGGHVFEESFYEGKKGACDDDDERCHDHSTTYSSSRT